MQALFKARFEQALESQKLNIKKKEQELRRKGINPDDPVAMASIRRVASTFFNAIDKKEGSPYVFQRDKKAELESSGDLQQPEPDDESDQEELNRFIAEIEDAAHKEWAAEEAAEKEEFGKIRYWNQEDLGDRFRRSEQIGDEESNDNIGGRSRNWSCAKHGRNRINASDNEDGDSSDDEEGWDSSDGGDVSEYETRDDDINKAHEKSQMHNVARMKQHNILENKRVSLKGNGPARSHVEKTRKDSVSKDKLSDLEDAVYDLGDMEEQSDIESRLPGYDYGSYTDQDNFDHRETDNKNGKAGIGSSLNNADRSEVIRGGFGMARENGKSSGNNGKFNSPIDLDETWDSD